MSSLDGDLDQRCAEVVERLIARHDWRLIDRSEFIRRTRAALADLGSADLQYIAYGVYNLALYQACSGAEGAQRRERAYEELFRVLYARAWRSYYDVCEDATQLAITDVIINFENCYEPRAFIPFAFRYLMGAARRIRRQAARDSSLEREVGEEGLTLGETLVATADIEAEAVAREQREALRRFLAEYVARHPRARNQIEAVRLKFLEGLDDQRISQELGVSVANVHVLRSRGLARLREAPGWQPIWEQEA